MRLDLKTGDETLLFVTLSRRNLLALLQKLSMPGSARTLFSANCYRDGERGEDLAPRRLGRGGRGALLQPGLPTRPDASGHRAVPDQRLGSGERQLIGKQGARPAIDVRCTISRDCAPSADVQEWEGALIGRPRSFFAHPERASRLLEGARAQGWSKLGSLNSCC